MSAGNSVPVHLHHIEYKPGHKIYVDVSSLELDQDAVITVALHYRPTPTSPPAQPPIVEQNPLITDTKWSAIRPYSIYFTPTAAGTFCVLMTAVTLQAGRITNVTYCRPSGTFFTVTA